MSYDGCNDCSPHASKENSPVTKKETTTQPVVDSLAVGVEIDTNEDKESVIDNKFLVASPRTMHKEKSVLDSDTEENFEASSSECMAVDAVTENGDNCLSHNEINAMFGRLAVEGNRGGTSSEPNFSEEGNITRSDSVISVSSSSDPGEPAYRKRTDAENRQRNAPKQRNILSSIHTILNENKTLDSKAKTNTRQQQNSKQNNQNQSKEDARKSGKGKNENKKKTRNSKKDNSRKSQSGPDEQGSARNAGLLKLPANYQEQHGTPEDKEIVNVERHVHFDILSMLIKKYLSTLKHRTNKYYTLRGWLKSVMKS